MKRERRTKEELVRLITNLETKNNEKQKTIDRLKDEISKEKDRAVSKDNLLENKLLNLSNSYQFDIKKLESANKRLQNRINGFENMLVMIGQQELNK